MDKTTYMLAVKKALKKAAGEFAKISEAGNKLNLTIDPSTFVMTLSLLAKDGTTLDTKEVDLPLEEMIINGSYNKTKKAIILKLKSGTTLEIPVGDLVSDLASKEYVDEQLATKQDTLTAGTNITIDENNVISATSGNVNSVNGKDGDVVLTGSDINVNIDDTGTTKTIQEVVKDLQTADDLHEQQIVSQAAAINDNILPRLSSHESDLANHREAILVNDENIQTVYGITQQKQDKLTSGTNIKTVNNQSVLGNGNLKVGTLSTDGIEKITDLTGHTWVANDVVDSQALRTLFGGNFNMYVNFTCNNYNMQWIREQDAAANIRYYQDGSTYWTVYHGGNPGSWSTAAWKTLQFTGDVDSRHTQSIHDGFIDWLYANGTFTDIPETRTSAIFENGGRVNPKTTWAAIEDKASIEETIAAKQDKLAEGTGIKITNNAVAIDTDMVADRSFVTSMCDMLGDSFTQALHDETNERKMADSLIETEVNQKQNNLVSGTNIKTINNQSILGSGNMNIGSKFEIIEFDVAKNQMLYYREIVAILSDDKIPVIIDGTGFNKNMFYFSGKKDAYFEFSCINAFSFMGGDTVEPFISYITIMNDEFAYPQIKMVYLNYN